MSIRATPTINKGRPEGLDTVGVIPVVAGLSVIEGGAGPVRQTIIKLDGLVVTMTDATTSNGGQKIYTFPRGQVAILGGTANFSDATTFASATVNTQVVGSTTTTGVASQNPYTNTTPGLTAGAGGIADGAALVWSIGTVAGAGATLTSTEANVVASVAATLVAGYKASSGSVVTTIALYSGETVGSAVDLYLNFAVPDADTSANDTLTVVGEIVLTWVNCGNR